MLHPHNLNVLDGNTEILMNDLKVMSGGTWLATKFQLVRSQRFLVEYMEKSHWGGNRLEFYLNMIGFSFFSISTQFIR